MLTTPSSLPEQHENELSYASTNLAAVAAQRMCLASLSAGALATAVMSVLNMLSVSDIIWILLSLIPSFVVVAIILRPKAARGTVLLTHMGLKADIGLSLEYRWKDVESIRVGTEEEYGRLARAARRLLYGEGRQQSWVEIQATRAAPQRVLAIDIGRRTLDVGIPTAKKVSLYVEDPVAFIHDAERLRREAVAVPIRPGGNALCDRKRPLAPGRNRRGRAHGVRLLGVWL